MAIVQKTINWNSEVWIKAVDSVAQMNGYQETITNELGESIPNPQGKIPFFNAWLKKQAINAITENDCRVALSTVTPMVDEG